jgi:abequosyltransferase
MIESIEKECLISICIPTFNRYKYLLKNLNIINDILMDLNISEYVEVIVSNNHSSDQTYTLSDFKFSSEKILYSFISNDENIGPEQNILSLLGRSKSKYVMLLGDDDYLTIEYVREVLNVLRSELNVAVFLPSFKLVDHNGDNFSPSRSVGLDLPSRVFEPNFFNILKNIQRGHSISGLVFIKDEILTKYKNYKINNLYPMVFFLSIAMLKGSTYHITKFPIIATDPESLRPWSYDKRGYFNEMLNNFYNNKDYSYVKRVVLQINAFIRERNRLLLNGSSALNVLISFFYVWTGKYILFPVRVLMPLLFGCIILLVFLRRVFRRLK